MIVAILFFIQCIINYVFHGYNGSPVKNKEVVEDLSYATYVLPSVFIAFGIFCLAVMLNVSCLVLQDDIFLNNIIQLICLIK